MDHQISEILRYSNEWKRIGIETSICKVEKSLGIRKLHKFSTRITDEIQKNPQKIPPGFNFLGVILTKSPLMCLDIEGNDGSVEEFMGILDENSLKICDFFGENTMNGGIHLYFRFDQSRKGRNLYRRRYKNIHFDVLFGGKSFTSPSIFGNKSYVPLGRSIFDLNDINDIPEFPKSLDFLI